MTVLRNVYDDNNECYYMYWVVTGVPWKCLHIPLLLQDEDDLDLESQRQKNLQDNAAIFSSLGFQEVGLGNMMFYFCQVEL